MMKGLISQQYQQQQQVLEENMSNLTSQSGTDQASVCSSGNIRAHSHEHFASPPSQPPAKKKRNLPGNPDPDAEVIALSPKTLMATNRFVCEICNKGFQRDQNLQLHRRGHNLPWKLKQRSNKEVIRKKVYVCPEASCVHHDPSRALGDLTGIKKHFCRKHGEKKWKCDKCSKRYAVQSDWKAHSKTCGTREYRCDCGTLFSRRDSFITHRAFCDALAEESARAVTGGGASANPILSSYGVGVGVGAGAGAGAGASSLVNLQIPPFNMIPQEFHGFSLKKEQDSFSVLPWLASQLQQQVPVLGSSSSSSPGPGPPILPPSHTVDHDLSSPLSSSSSLLNSRLNHHPLITQTPTHHQDWTLNDINDDGAEVANPSPSLGPTQQPLANYPHQQTVGNSSSSAAAGSPSPHMSATALLQKAAQMGATMSSCKNGTATGNSSSSSSPVAHHHRHHHAAVAAAASLIRPHPQQQQVHVSGTATTAATPDHPAGINIITNTTKTTGFGPDLSSRKGGFIHNHGSLTPPSSPFQEMMMMNNNNTAFSSSGYEHHKGVDTAASLAFSETLMNSKKDHHHHDHLPVRNSFNDSSSLSKTTTRNMNDYHYNGEGLTRDFLELRPLSQSDILNFASGLPGDCINNTSRHHQHTPWQGN